MDWNPGILFPWVQDAAKSAMCVSLAATVPPTAKRLHSLLNASCLYSSWCQAVFYYIEPTVLMQGFGGREECLEEVMITLLREGNSLKPWPKKNSCWLHTEAHTSLPLTNVMPQSSFNTDQSLDNNILLGIKKEGSGCKGRVQGHEKGNWMGEKKQFEINLQPGSSTNSGIGRIWFVISPWNRQEFQAYNSCQLVSFASCPKPSAWCFHFALFYLLAFIMNWPIHSVLISSQAQLLTISCTDAVRVYLPSYLTECIQFFWE